MKVKRALSLDLGLDEKVIVSYKPSNISIEGMKLLFQDVPESVKEYARTLRDKGWRFYACDQKSGWCIDGGHKIIVIPTYVIIPTHQWYRAHKIGYKTYYIAHEMAHAFVGTHNGHNQIFMECFKKICPLEFQHWELEYKPREAKKAGIMLL